MTLAELIAELGAATDGATEDTNFPRAVDKLFPEITALRVMYKKRGEKTIVFSQIQVYVENIGTAQEAAFYPEGKIPAPLVEASRVPVDWLFTNSEIKTAVNKPGFKIITKRNEDDHMIVDGYIDDSQDATVVRVTSWYVFKSGGVILAKRIS